jgi:hypothetical protein
MTPSRGLERLLRTSEHRWAQQISPSMRSTGTILDCHARLPTEIVDTMVRVMTRMHAGELAKQSPDDDLGPV